MLIITICYIIGIIMGLYLKINIALLLFTIIGILVINCFLQMKMRQIEDDEQHINHEKKSIDKIILIIGFIMIIISFFIVRSKENKISDICNSINKNAQFTGVVVDIDPTSDYPYKVIFDDAKTPEVRGKDGIWIWKELPMRKIERG